MGGATSFIDCPRQPPLFWVRSRCGKDRDCVPDDRQPGSSFQEIICAALIWNSLDPTRYVEVWTPDNTRKILTVRGQWGDSRYSAPCGPTVIDATTPGDRSDRDPFTIDIPGIQDIIKVKQWESPQLRYERYKRFESARSAVPKPLQWIPPLLTKLDNAQDLIYTQLVIGFQILKRLAPRALPYVGWLLTLNDVMNLFT